MNSKKLLTAILLAFLFVLQNNATVYNFNLDSVDVTCNGGDDGIVNVNITNGPGTFDIYIYASLAPPPAVPIDSIKNTTSTS